MEGLLAEIKMLKEQNEQLQKQVDELTAENKEWRELTDKYSTKSNKMTIENDCAKSKRKQAESKLEYIYKWLAESMPDMPCNLPEFEKTDIAGIDETCEAECSNRGAGKGDWQCWAKYFESMTQESVE